MPERKAPAALLAAVLALAALGSAACKGEPERPDRPQPPRNVILIVVDTLRADRLSAFGYARPTTPNLAEFARHAVRFDAARSQAACTFPSVNSILTSRWPAAFLGQPNQALGIPAGIPSLAEILQARGFHTVAVSASAVVRKSPSRFNPGGGFARGFDVFHEDCVWQPASCVDAAAAEHLRPGSKPLFLYLHYIDPHGPYQPPPAWRRRFATGNPEKEWVRKGDPNPIGDWLYKGKPNPGFTPQDLQHLKDLYDEEIGFVDSQLGALFGRLRRTGLLKSSLVILAADHGEEFLEHGDVKHCRNLFDTSLHVPLVVRVPATPPRVVASPVQNLDLVPTVIDYLGIKLGIEVTGKFAGRSLRAEIEGRAAPEIQYAIQGSQRSAADGRYKLIADLAAGTQALYDLKADPGETKDVLAAERRAYAPLREALTRWLARSEGKGTADASRAAQERLRSLGYIE